MTFALNSFLVQSASSYIGPGDVATFTAFYGVRAATNAYAVLLGSAFNLRRSSDNGTMTANFLSTGDLDTATISAWAGGSNIFVSQAYDHIGSNHVSQGASGSQPRLFLTGGANNLPYLSQSNVATVGLGGSNVTPTGSACMSLVAQRSAGNFGIFGSQNGPTTGNRIFPTGFAASWTLAGSSGTIIANATNNAWHYAQGVINGASSELYIDTASAVTGSITLSTATAVPTWMNGASSSTVLEEEFGVVSNSPWTGTQIANLKTNQAAYYAL